MAVGGTGVAVAAGAGVFVGGTGVAVGSLPPHAMTIAVTATAAVASQSDRCLLKRGFLNCFLRVVVGCGCVAQVWRQSVAPSG